MKVRVSVICNLIISLSYCSCLRFFTSIYDYEVHPEPATFGVSSRDDEFPFMTALGWRNNVTDEMDFLCGGMLVSPNFVLTAAHCVFFEGKLPNLIKIGGNILNSTYNEEHTVRNYFIHPWYDENQAYDDVALLQLGETSGKSPVCLWSRPTLTTKRVTAIGYGATKFAGNSTSILQKVNLIVVSTRVCRVYHEKKRKFRYGISDDLLCAGDPKGRQDTCDGDSGGPLIVRSDYVQYAVGIIANGQACFGFPPSVYTRITPYIGWIAGILQEQNFPKLRICD